MSDPIRLDIVAPTGKRSTEWDHGPEGTLMSGAGTVT